MGRLEAVVSGALDTVSDPRVLAAVSRPGWTQFDAEQWLAEQGTLYLVGTRDAQASVAPLLAAIFEDLFHRDQEQAFLAHDLGKAGGCRRCREQPR